MEEHVRSALKRGLPVSARCPAHDNIMSVAGGGPSLADTYSGLTGVIVSCNKSLSFLLDRDITPWACGVMDPGEHMADLIEPRRDVFYFLASVCHPRTFDKLTNAGCQVILWHALGLPTLEVILNDMRPGNWSAVGGGTTIGLRWVNLGYSMGFRTFHLHGVDSSYRKGERYAYSAEGAPAYHTMTVDGFLTSPNLMGQVEDFQSLLKMYSQPDIEPTTIEVFGDGLLPHWYRKHKEKA